MNEEDAELIATTRMRSELIAEQKVLKNKD